MAFDQNKYKHKFEKEHYDVFNLTLRKGHDIILKEYAKSKGISVSQLIIRALEKTYLLDLTGDLD